MKTLFIILSALFLISCYPIASLSTFHDNCPKEEPKAEHAKEQNEKYPCDETKLLREYNKKHKPGGT